MKNKVFYLVILLIILFLSSCNLFTSTPPNYLVGHYNEEDSGETAERELIFHTNTFSINDNSYNGTYEFEYTKFRQEKKGIVQEGYLTMKIENYPDLKMKATLNIVEFDNNVIVGKLTLVESKSNSEIARQFFKNNISLNSLAKITYELNRIKGGN